MSTRNCVRVVALLLLPVAGVLSASQAGATPPETCSQPPSIVVDQSDPSFSRITIAVSCHGPAHLHRIVSATVGGVEVLSVDTLTDIVADASSVTKIKIPKAQVCVTDPDSGSHVCVPPSS